jgi:hypothetical protein
MIDGVWPEPFSKDTITSKIYAEIIIENFSFGNKILSLVNSAITSLL